MKTSSSYLRLTAKEWAWGRPAYWKVYSSLKLIFRPYLDKCSLSALSTLCDKFIGEEEDSCRCCRTRQNRYGDKHVGCYEGFLALNGRFGSIVNTSFYNRTRARHFTSSQKLYSRLHSARKYCTESGRSLLSRDEINDILRTNENSASLLHGLVSRCELNQLASNQPIEDQLFAAKSILENTLLFGVIDGHGGCAFARQVRERLPCYVSAAIAGQLNVPGSLDDITSKIARDIFQFSEKEQGFAGWEKKLQSYMTEVVGQHRRNSNKGVLSYMSVPLRQIFGTKVMGDYPEESPEADITDALKEAFVRLDRDMVAEIREQASQGALTKNYASLAFSGCCAIVACISNKDLYVANAGDCRAVLGSYSDERWSAVQLTQDHTAISNPEEVKRIFAEHPRDEMRSAIQYGRLLGRLAPLRAFGDIQFKLDAAQQKAIFTPLRPDFQVLPALRTPPYLTAEPEVFRYRLTWQDRFVVLASDGLWDMLNNQEVVELVGSYLDGKGADRLEERTYCMENPRIESVHATADDVSEDNVATFLIRYALGGCDQYSLSTMLTLPHPEVRMYRDDISVTVIFFDHDK